MPQVPLLGPRFRAIMIRIYGHAEGHGLWEEGKQCPVSKAKLGKKSHKYERKILSEKYVAKDGHHHKSY